MTAYRAKGDRHGRCTLALQAAALSAPGRPEPAPPTRRCTRCSTRAVPVVDIVDLDDLLGRIEGDEPER